MTQALHEPEILRGNFNYLNNNQRFGLRPVRTPEAFEGQETILITRVFNKSRLVWLIVALLLLAPAMGVTAGMVSHRVDVGAVVAVGIIGLVAVLPGLIAWFLK